jgi:dihydrofolate synthase / folylpolyglutamate synthase
VETSYSTAVEWLFSTQAKGVKLGLENVCQLLDRLGNPQRRLRFIHVAGTNGKGSVCAMLDSILREAGYRTGLYTSPHLVRLNERIQVQGIPIDDESVVEGIEQIKGLFEEEHHPTFFEIMTAMAFDHFRRCDAEIVILETGLGGRMDATNVVTPLVSVLTSIDLDHQKWLGNTLAEIAFEKAGIIKSGVPVVSISQLPEVRTVITNVAQRKSSRLMYVDSPLNDVVLGLPGSHQRLNAAVAVTALQTASLKVNPSAVRQGLQRAFWPGRFQRISDRIILDGAHNTAASRRLVQTWREHFGPEQPIVIFGGLRDKDLSTMTAELTRIARHFLIVPVNSPRTASPYFIRDALPAGVAYTVCESVQEALDRADHLDAKILITGSLFLVGQVMAMLEPAKGEFQISTQ